jgi:hypothetical protein
MQHRQIEIKPRGQAGANSQRKTVLMFEVTNRHEKVNGCKAQMVKHVRVGSDEADPHDNVQEIFEHIGISVFDLPTLPKTCGTRGSLLGLAGTVRDDELLND